MEFIKLICKNQNPDSQIDFDIGNISCTFWGMGVLHKNVSQILATTDI